MTANAEAIPIRIESKCGIEDLVDVRELRCLFEQFTRATGLGLALLDQDGDHILISTGWWVTSPDPRVQSARAELFGKRVLTRAVELVNESNAPAFVRWMAGLVGRATPIVFDGLPVATLIAGPILPVESELARTESGVHVRGPDGVDLGEVLDAASVMHEAKLEKMALFLAELVLVLARLGRERLAAVQRAAEEQHSTNIVRARARLFRYAMSHALDDVLEQTLNELETLTGSRIGFYHFVDSDQKGLTLQNWSTSTKNQFCEASAKGAHYPIAQAGVWVDCVYRRAPVIHNDYAALPHKKGLPPGHAQVDRELVVPVMRGDKIVAILGLGNKPSPYDDRDVRLVTLFADLAWDLAERKRAEEEIRRTEQERLDLHERLAQSQKLESLGRLAGGVAHDFNNLLTVIGGYSDLVLRSLDEDDELHADVRKIKQASERAADLTRQLLAFGRKQIIAPRVMNINESLRDSRDMLGRLIGEDIELVYSLAEDLRLVEVDPGQIVQILFNLAINARDAMPSGGRLTIETKNVLLEGTRAAIHPEAQAGPHVLLTVGDTGQGMNEQTRSRIFEPFFTTKEQGKGTGLGLATVYGIVVQHGGAIDVRSEPGVGTTFELYFPVTTLAEPLKWSVPVPNHGGGAETILLVEDEAEVRNITRRILEKYGYEILEAASGAEAIKLCRSYRGRIDLLLTDVVMPGMSGPECYGALRELRRDLGVLYMSGYTDDRIAHRGVLEEGTDLLQKPFSVFDLAQKVREVLDKGR